MTTAQPTIGVRHLLVSEWTKLRSVRSTYITTILAALAAVALAVAICARTVQELHHGKLMIGDFDPTTTSLYGIYLAQVAVGALGVLVISSEYGTGMIRATLAAVPQRRAMLASKGLVFVGLALLVGEVLSFTAFWLGQAILSQAGAGASFAQPAVLRATVGGGLYLAAVGALGFGLGALLRHTAGALSAFFGVLFASTALVDLLPTTWRNAIIEYLPANAGSQILTVDRAPDSLPPWAGYGVFCLYAAVAITLAMIAISRRDA